MELDETWQEGRFGQAPQNDIVVFWFGNHGAEQFSAEGGKMGVFVVFEDF